jgi:hypothetical protein
LCGTLTRELPPLRRPDVKCAYAVVQGDRKIREATMFRTKLTLAGLVVAMMLAASGSGRALAAAVALTKAQQSVRFVTDTLAPGGTTRVAGYRFTTDTLAPGGGPSAVFAPTSHSFDWGDAGIGAVVMSGIALALLGSRRALQRRRVVAA